MKPDGGSAPGVATLSNRYVFKVFNPATETAAYAVRVACTAPVSSCTLDNGGGNSIVEIPGQTFADVAVTFTGPTTGSGRIVLYGSNYDVRTLADSGYVTASLAAPTYTVSVAPTPATVSTLGLGGYTHAFTVKNDGNAPATYALSAACEGAVACDAGSVDQAQLLVAPGAQGTARVTYSAQTPGQSGAVRLTAEAGGYSSTGVLNVSVAHQNSMSVQPSGPPVVSGPGPGMTPAYFTVKNTGTGRATFALTGSADFQCLCRPDPMSVPLEPNASAQVAVNVEPRSSGTVTLTATDHAAGYSRSASQPVTPGSYTVAVAAQGGTGTRFVEAGQAGMVENFTVSNTGDTPATFRFDLACNGSGVRCDSTRTQLSIAGYSSVTVPVWYTAGGAAATGTVGLQAAGPSNTASASAPVTVISRAVSVAATPATVAPVDSGRNSHLFTVQNAGNVPADYALTAACGGALAAGCTRAPATVSLGVGASDTVRVTYDAQTRGATGTVRLTATATAGTFTNAAELNVQVALPLYGVRVEAPASGGTLAVTPGPGTTSADFRVYNPTSRASVTYDLFPGASFVCPDCRLVGPSTINVSQDPAGTVVTVVYTRGRAGTLSLTARDQSNPSISRTATYSVVSANPTSTVVVTAAPGPGAPVPAGSYVQAFAVENTGDTDATYTLAAACANGVSCASPPAPPLALRAGTKDTVRVPYQAETPGATGTVRLTATAGAFSNGAQVSVPIKPSYAVAVTPKSGVVRTDGGRASLTVGFTLENLGSVTTTTYRLVPTCAGAGAVPGTCKVLPDTTVVTKGTPKAVSVRYTSGGPGDTARVTLRAVAKADAAYADSGRRTVVVNSYAATLTPPAPDTAFAGVARTLTFTLRNVGNVRAGYALTATCVNTTVCPAARTVDVDSGSAKAVALSYTAGGEDSVGTVKVTVKDGTYASAVAVSATATFEVHSSRVVLSPRGATVSPEQGTTGSQQFTIENRGTLATTYGLAVRCSGVTGCTTPSAPRVPAGESRTVSVAYKAGVFGTNGTIRLVTSSTDPSGRDSVTVAVVPVKPGAPLVALGDANQGGQLERGRCLTVALTPTSAAECGDLRVVHALPTIRTMAKARTPTLLYNSAHASPLTLFALNVTRPANAPVYDTVKVAVTAGGVARGSGSWAGSQWGSGATRRVVVAIDASGDGTGVQTYDVAVTVQSGGTTLAAPTRKYEVAVVNRQQSPFGSGWWLAGLEQIVIPTATGDTSRVWVGGDGSVRRYLPAGRRVWAAPSADRPDTLRQIDDTTYVRYAEGGVQVRFDGFGRHVATINRLGHTTRFRYGIDGRLDTLVVPTPRTGTAYWFTYTSVNGKSRLSAIDAPRNGTAARTVTPEYASPTTWAVTKFTDPDTSSVGFGYATGAPSGRIASSTNRRALRTWYAYAPATGAVTSASDTVGQQPVVTTLAPVELKGFAGASVDTAEAFGAVDGPRVDVVDVTKYWMNGVGAVRKVVNARGDTTRTTYGDPAWPALATRVEYPRVRQPDQTWRQRVQTAAYDARGNLTLSTEVNPYDDGQDAPWHYRWDGKFDVVTRAVSPLGVITSRGYDPANGNLVWQQVGKSAARRDSVFYNYDRVIQEVRSAADLQGKVASISIVPDSLGNAAAVRSARDVWVETTNDGLGRPTVRRTQIDSAGSATVQWQVDTITYDAADRAKTVTSNGPAMSGAPAQRLVVKNDYELDGTLKQVSRVSATSDSSIVGTLVTKYESDVAGRRTAEVAGDKARTSWYLNPAGLADSVRTRRGRVLRMYYDELGRLRSQATDSVRYGQTSKGFPKYGKFVPKTDSVLPFPAPRYPGFTNDGTSYTVWGDSTVLAYDAAGNMVQADNADAKVRRGYYTGGALASETLQIRTVERDEAKGSTFDKHRYTSGYRYDLDGRRTVLVHPPELTGQPGEVATTYGYDPETGEPQTLTDILSNTFTFGHDWRGQLVSVVRPGEIEQRYEYDNDGALRLDEIVNGAVGRTPYSWPDALLRSTRLEYDGRGKVLRSVDAAGPHEVLTSRYAGLGALVFDSLWTESRTTQGLTGYFATRESYVADALGDVKSSVINSWQRTNQGGGALGNWTFMQSPGATHTYVRNGTGRLAVVQTAQGSDTVTYDASGNTVWSTKRGVGSTVPPGSYADRASYYGADEKLRAVDSRSAQLSNGNIGNYTTAFEEYRYDALGRRVLVHTRRWCNNGDGQGECRISKIRRLVWDGSNELWEVQMPGELNAPELENDTGPVGARAVVDETNYKTDPNGYFGRVVYTDGVATDQPLSVVRFDYTDARLVDNSTAPPLRWAPFAIFPLWNHRGLATQGVFADGAVRKCAPVPLQPHCVAITWPGWYYAYARASARDSSWHGSLLNDKRDGAGTLYRRNRVYDPATGRFTQEDPIGLAGGLNAYGFANGDPVNYSDPFGTCPVWVAAADGPEPGPADLLAAVLCWTEVKAGLDVAGRFLSAAKPDANSSRAARRSAMRAQGIPTSRPPDKQRCDDNGNRQYEYQAQSDATRVVTHHEADANHPLPHWEAGTMKPVEQYGTTPNGQARHFNTDPASGRPKSKCTYEP